MAYGLEQPNRNVSHSGVRDYIPQNVQEVKGVATSAATSAATNIADTAQNDTFLSAATNKEMTPGVVAGTLGLWGGMAALSEWLNHKQFSGKWEDSLLGKMQKFGSTIDGGVKKALSPITTPLKSSTGLQAFKNKFSFLATPLKNVNNMAKSQGNGILAFTVTDHISLLEDYVKKAPENFKHLFPKAKNSEAVLKVLGNIKNDPMDCKKTFDFLLKNLRANGDKAHVVDTLFTIPFTKIKVPNIPALARKTSFNQMANKMQAVMGTEGAKGLGKHLPKSFGMGLEGATNGFAGGKILILIQAAIFAQAIKKTIDAPKGEKMSTFMEAVTSDLAYIATVPLLTKIPNAIGGMKYMGMGRNAAEQTLNVKRYRDAIKNLNGLSGNINYAQYSDKVKNIKNMLSGKSIKDAATGALIEMKPKLWQKPFKFIGKVLSTGLETIKPFNFAGLEKATLGQKLGSKALNAGSKFKGMAGGLGRFAIAMFVLSPILSRMVTKISHKLFGRPTDSVLNDHEKAQAEKKAAKEAKKAAKEAAKNASPIDPQALAKRLEQHPELVATIENNPEMLQQISQNPQLLVSMLDEADKMKGVAPNGQKPLSPAMAEYLKRNPGAQTQQVSQVPQAPQATITPAQQPTPQTFDPSSLNQNSMDVAPKQPAPSTMETANPVQQPVAEPKRSYVPSSEPFKKISSGQGEEIRPEVNDALARADRAEAAAMKYLN